MALPAVSAPPAHQIASAAIEATVAVVSVRDPADGLIRYSISYESHASRWLCEQRFHSLQDAEAAALVLASYLGASFQG
jgi:hypothetical protein